MKLVSNNKSVAFAAILVATICVAPGQAQNGQPLQTIQTDLNALKAQVAMLATQASVAALQGQLAGLATQASVAAVQAQLPTLATQASVSTLQGKVDDLASQTSVTALQTQLSSLSALVGNLQSQGSRTSEVWRFGLPRVDGTTGQVRIPLAGPITFFYSSTPAQCGGSPSCVNGIGYFENIALQAMRVRQVYLLVANRTGSYGLGLNLIVEVRSLDNVPLRVISTMPIDLETVNHSQYVEVPIIDSDAAIVAPTEHLGFRVSPGGATGGTLTLQVALAAVVQTP